MKGRFVTGIVTGALIGAAASMMYPMNNRTRRRMVRRGRRMAESAGELWDDMKGRMW